MGRTVVSDWGSESYRVAEYIDFFLNLLLHIHPSHVKDTYDFVRKSRSLKVSSNTFLFSIDVQTAFSFLMEPRRGVMELSFRHRLQI